MTRWLIVGAVACAACGGDDDGGGGNLAQCNMTATGDASATSQCRMFLCYPINDTYQSLLLSSPMGEMYQLALEVDAPTVFAPGTYTLDQLRPQTRLSVTLDGRQFVARQNVTGGRHADETATLAITAVHAPMGNDVCSGWIDGTVTATLVELVGTSGSEMVGTGRVSVTVQLGD